MRIDQEKGTASTDEKAFDEEAYKKQKKDLMKFFDEEIPFLKKKAEYENLVTEIAVAEATRLQATTTMVTIKNQINQAAKQFQEQAAQQKKEPINHQK